MDIEILKSLGWFLFWSGLLFVVMRYGCCRHMMRGRGSGGHGGHCETTTAGSGKDPVCGMSVDSKNAAAAAVRDGSTYYFCSTACRDKFEQSPGSYVADSTLVGHQHEGHHA